MQALINTDEQRQGIFLVVAPVRADLAAEVTSQPVNGAANVTELLLRCEAFDVPTVPQNPSSHRHQHKQGSCKINQSRDLWNEADSFGCTARVQREEQQVRLFH